jgi:hypothetical protein
MPSDEARQKLAIGDVSRRHRAGGAAEVSKN